MIIFLYWVVSISQYVSPISLNSMNKLINTVNDICMGWLGMSIPSCGPAGKILGQKSGHDPKL
jgi:hypothetical protein